MSKKIFSSLSAILFATLTIALTPFPAQANECQGSQCQITFSYTGEPQTWNIPDGATNILFDVQGASGGRNGGLGGRVTGQLNAEYSQLQIYVGGAGLTGASVNGGFNGGGVSGGNRTNEGSGGGASDIRLTDSLDSRLVVAGGGGGTGGFSGGAGGHGGGENASAGQSGQGGGGGGGTQTTGGYAGTNNGGSALSTGGTFGQGGNGGISWNAGGGGGGGGWFGGGGGGSDDNECCSDGGGGGGGSSYANVSVTSNIQHTSGFRSGNGVVVISYELSPRLIQFSGQQISTDLVLFILEYNLPISGLDPSDLSLSGEGCSISSIQAISNRSEIIIKNCTQSPELEIAPNSFTIGSSEQSAGIKASVEIDLLGPSITLSAHTSSEPSIILLINVDDAVNLLSESSLEVTGCDVAGFENEPAIQLHLNNCQEGVAEILIQAGALQDSFGNSSMAHLHSLYFDLTPPLLNWSTPKVTGTDVFHIETVLVGSEAFELTADSIQLSGNSESCTHTITPLENAYLVSIDGCTEGELVLQLPANSAFDLYGHSAPIANLVTTIELRNSNDSTPVNEVYPQEPKPQIPEPEAEAPSTVIEVPVDQPIASPIETPNLDEVADSPQPDLEPQPLIPEYQTEIPEEAESIGHTAPTPSLNSEAKGSSSSLLEEMPNSTKNYTDSSEGAGEMTLAESVAFETSKELQTDKSYLLGGLVVLAILSLGGVGALLLRLAENNRSRAIK